MLKNFFAIAARSFLRQRFYSVLNVLGLASGLACALFIFLWVRDEVEKDKFHRDADRIFRIVSTLDLGDGEIVTWTITPGPLADAVADQVPEVELAVRTMDVGPQLLQFGDKNFLERGYYADSTFFKVLSFEILKGDAGHLDKSAVAISDKLANNLFPGEDPIGKLVKFRSTYDLEVRAVFREPDHRSSLKFSFIAPMDIYKQERGNGWNWGNYDHPLYLKLNPSADPSAVIAKINDIENERVRNLSGDKPPEEAINFLIQPLGDMYLHSNFTNGQITGGRIEYVRIFTIVAAFILVIACINFMNMATARAASRAKEVGVRKVVGAQRQSLVYQFIGESILISFVSMLVALGIVFFLLPAFNALVSKNIAFTLTDGTLLISAISIVLVTGVLAGSYPAFYLSSYKPATVLKGSMVRGSAGSGLRKSLVVFQFALTVVLVASAIVVFRQVEFIRNKNIGFQRDAVLSFSARGGISRQFDAFRNEARQVPGIELISRSNASLVQVNNQNGSVVWPGKPDNVSVMFRTVVVDYGFPEAMGLKLVEGRFFNESDTISFVVSRKAVEVMGLQDPIGQQISQWGRPGVIIGVVEDLHVRSMHEPIDPIVLMCQPNGTGRVFVKYDRQRAQEVVAAVEQLARKYAPEYPFEYTFVDEDFERLYNNEKVIGSLAAGFTIMAIIISALGLLGLAAFTAERRRKEISIRKTLGASVSGIITMISGDFVKLSLIAAVIGCPAAWWLMTRFLENYAYHTDLRWDIFLTTAAAVVVVSIVTVIVQVTRAALANPVDALRNE